MKKKINKNKSNLIKWLCVSLLFIIAFFYFAPSLKVFNFTKPLVIMSGSMEPNLKTGSLVFISKTESYKVNDIITFTNPDMPSQKITHRVVNIKDSGETKVYKTKGDANEESDSETIKGGDILGEVVFSIPLLGYLVFFAKTRTGVVFLVLIPSAIFVFFELQSIFRKLKKIKKAKI